VTRRKEIRRGAWRLPVAGDLALGLWRWDAVRKADLIDSFVSSEMPDGSPSVLEIGSGPGTLLETLRARRYRVDGADVKNGAYRAGLEPVLYDGKVLPFEDGAYDLGLLFTVLHHVREPETVLREALRVAQRLLVLEDLFRNRAEEKIVHAADSLVNLEFWGHPHNNRTKDGWLDTFEACGGRGRQVGSLWIAGIFEQALFDVRRASM
jgi:SAM-dependent methyltransferase